MPNNGNGIIPAFSGELPLSQLKEAGVAIHIHEGGVITIDGRSINVTGNVTGSAVNTGDNVSQTVNWGAQETESFSKLLTEIKNLPGLNADETQDATEILGDLKKKSEEGTLRPSLLERIWNQLPKAVTALESAVKVYDTLSPSLS